MRLLLAARLTTKQAGGQNGIGLDSQDKRGKLWAEQAGHEVVATAAGTAKGTVAPWDRKYLKPWVTKPELMSGYDGILCYATDRLSRGTQEDFTRIEAWATEHGKCLVIAGGNGVMYPARDDSDYWQWAATKREARREWETIRERSVRAQTTLRDAGKLVGRTPWGFTSEGAKYDRRMVPTAAGERYAEEIFQRIADDHTLPAVAEWLLASHVPTAQDDYVVIGPLRPWHHRVIAALVRNPAYRGEHRNGGRKVHKCPALVSGDLWRRANASLDSRPSSRRGQRNDIATGAALLSGIGTCGNPDCTAGPDSPMCKSGVSYRCTGRGAVRKGCGNMVPVASVDALMNGAMSGLRRPVLRPVFHPATGHQVEIDDMQQQLDSLAARRLPRAEFRGESDRLYDEIERLEALPHKPARTEWSPVLDDDGHAVTYGTRWQQSDQAARRAWLRDAAFALSIGKPEHDVAGDDDDDDLSSRTDVYEDSRAVLTFRWSGDSDAGLGRGLPGQGEAA